MKPKQLLDFLRQHRVAVESSVSASGAPQAAIIGVAFTDDFEIIFDTVESTRKAKNLRQNPQLAFVIGGWGPGDQKTVQYEGVPDEPMGAELERIKPIYYAVYPDGPSRLAWTGLIYLRVRPTWLRYSNYSVDPPEIVEFTPAQLTG